MEKYVKARKQGNSIVVTIPSNLAVAPIFWVNSAIIGVISIEDII